MIPLRTLAAAALMLPASLLSSAARAAPEEIQVYMDELGQAGEVGLDIHVNHVLEGDGTPAYPGAETSLHGWRITPEFSLGLGHGFEAGAYLPLATIAPDGVLRASGVKMRLKWLAPHHDEGFYWGANVEVGRVAHRLDENPWNSEVKLIGGWRQGRWIAAVNGNVDFALSGPNIGPATFELTSKLGYRLTPRLMLGAESYNELGPLRSPGPLSQTEHATYLVLDSQLGKWDINAGIGKGYGSNADTLLIKFVIGVPIGH